MIIVWGVEILITVFLSYLLQILFHEIGHMIAGVITGWRLIYLQFFHFVITKDQDISIHKVSFSTCQCIMSPKTMKSNSHLYTLGGLVANLVITCGGFYGMLAAGFHPIPFLLSMCFFASGIALLLVNGVPHIGKVCNDMACYLLTKKNKSTMHSHNTQLIIAGELFKGKTYSEIEAALFDSKSYTEINDITAYSILLEYYFHMDRDEFIKAKQALLQIADFSMVSENVRHIYMLELFYLYMILSIYGCDTFQSSLLPHRDEELSYLEDNTNQGDIHAYRVGAMHQAYTKIRECDIEGAEESLSRSLDAMKELQNIYSGEKLFCQDQLRAILNMLNRMVVNTEDIAL